MELLRFDRISFEKKGFGIKHDDLIYPVYLDKNKNQTVHVGVRITQEIGVKMGMDPPEKLGLI